MLSDLQRRIIDLVGSLDPSPDLALAGGAALILRGLVQRTTNDLDFFLTDPTRLQTTGISLVEALEAAGYRVTPIVRTSSFIRVQVSSDGQDCIVDVGVDARILPLQPGPPVPTVAADELAADKVLALFDRAEARDFVDVHQLASRHGRDRLLELAALKDTGFDHGVFADMLAAVHRLPPDEFEVDDATYQELIAFADDWRDELRGSSHPGQGPGSEPA